MHPIPIFIISFNKLTQLEKSISSYTKFSSKIQIIICDNGSDYPPLLKYLKNLHEKQGIPVYYNKKVNHDNLYNVIAKNIKHWNKKNNSPFYVITDPDVCFIEECPTDILAFYAHILNKYKKIEAVGPMLKIDDIPDHYIFKQKVFKQKEQFWTKPSFNIQYNNQTFEAKYAPIDTTFALYRRNYVKKHNSVSIRTCYPYLARHLDWYINYNNLTDEEKFYMKTCNKTVSHWGINKKSI